MGYPLFITNKISFPPFFHVQMQYPREHIQDIKGALDHSLDEVMSESGIGPGDRVAVAVGSRGISSIQTMVKEICAKLIHFGAHPIIIPAMGSHGGATNDGQIQVLHSLGIHESSCGVPICSSLEVDRIDTVFGDVPVYFSRDALQADHSICINRIKPHTKFKGILESGIFKMLCVGMGKHRGALTYHKWALKYGFYPLLRAMGGAVAEKSNFRFGIGVVENAYDNTLKIASISPHNMFQKEAALLETAKGHFPKLPVDRIHVLVIEYIGKEISGAGMDPNVTGRAFDLKESDFSTHLNATRLVILNLTENTGGNGIGLGNADIITEKVFQKLDYGQTLMNALTSLSLRKAFIPIRLPDDRKAIQAGFTTLGPVPPEEVRAIIIRDTKHVTEFWASSPLREEIENISGAEIGDNRMLSFNSYGNLTCLFK
jgi:hypothetical protein